MHNLGIIFIIDSSVAPLASNLYSIICACSVFQSCPALCDPMDCGPLGSSAHGIPGKDIGVGCHFLLQVLPVLRLLVGLSVGSPQCSSSTLSFRPSLRSCISEKVSAFFLPSPSRYIVVAFLHLSISDQKCYLFPWFSLIFK